MIYLAGAAPQALLSSGAFGISSGERVLQIFSLSAGVCVLLHDATAREVVLISSDIETRNVRYAQLYDTKSSLDANREANYLNMP